MANQRLSPGVYRGQNGQLTHQANPRAPRPMPPTGGPSRMAAPGWQPPANPQTMTPNMQMPPGGGLGGQPPGMNYQQQTDYNFLKNKYPQILGPQIGHAMINQDMSGMGASRFLGKPQINGGMLGDALGPQTGGGEPFPGSIPQGNIPDQVDRGGQVPNDYMARMNEQQMGMVGQYMGGSGDPGLAGPGTLPRSPYNAQPAGGAPSMQPMQMAQAPLARPAGASKGILSRPPAAKLAPQRVSPGVYRQNGKLVKR